MKELVDLISNSQFADFSRVEGFPGSEKIEKGFLNTWNSRSDLEKTRFLQQKVTREDSLVKRHLGKNLLEIADDKK